MQSVQENLRPESDNGADESYAHFDSGVLWTWEFFQCPIPDSIYEVVDVIMNKDYLVIHNLDACTIQYYLKFHLKCSEL